MSGASTPEIESNLTQAYTQGSLDKNKIWTTLPLADDIGIPPAKHLALLPIGADEAIRLYDDPQGNARWTSAHAMYANFSRYQAPVHPASRTLKELSDEGEGKSGWMSESGDGSGAEETDSDCLEVAEGFDRGEETASDCVEVAESFDRGEERVREEETASDCVEVAESVDRGEGDDNVADPANTWVSEADM